MWGFLRMNWLDRIQEAKKNGFFDEEATTDSGNWHFCAVGEVLNLKESSFGGSIIEKFLVDNAEKYHPIHTKGCAFATAVYENKPEDAEQLLETIQRRCKDIDPEAFDNEMIEWVKAQDNI